MHRLAILAAALALGGCQIILGIDDPPTSYATAVTAYGLIAPVDVRLVSATLDETITIAADGVAKFSSRPIEGDAYAVSVASASGCVLGGGQSGVAEADIAVSLTCPRATRLATLELATLTGTQPVLADARLGYAVAVSELQQATTVTATAVDPSAILSLDGAPLAAGVASSPIALAPTTTTIELTVDHPIATALRSAYTIDVARTLALADRAYAKANPQSNDFLGRAVAIDGDDLVVGALGEGSLTDPDDPADQGAAQSGAVYVFRRDAGTWRRAAALKAPDVHAGDMFGYAVAIAGDRLIVGAPFESSATAADPLDTSASHAGAAYVFRRDGTSWVFEAYLKAAAPAADALFGWSVAISGERAVVGAPATSDVASGSGEAFVFHRVGTAWSLEGALHDDALGQGGLGDHLGEAVAIRGDLAAVGAINGEVGGSPAPNTGSVRTYARVGGVWEWREELAADDLAFGSWFGAAIALTDERMVVGAPAVVAGTAGAAYVYRRTGETWVREQRLAADAPSEGDELGMAVAMFGDTVAIGAYREDGSGAGVDPPERDNATTDSGAVYVFRRQGATWMPRRYLKSSHPGADDWFGRAVALSGDALVVGASSEASASLTDPTDDSAPGAGACTVYH